jgi:hypothetical protein
MPATVTGDRGATGWLPSHLPTLLLISSGLLGIAAVVGGLLRGVPGALGAAGGVGVVALAYLLSTLLIARGESVNPRLVMPLGMASYVLKLTLVGTLLYVVSRTGWPGLMPMVAGVIAGVAVLTAAHVWWVARWASRQPVPPPDWYLGEQPHDRAE